MVVIGVNGMELDIIRPLLLKGKMPDLARIVSNGAYGKLRTSHRVIAKLPTRAWHHFYEHQPEDHGVTGFLLGGITANTKMLKQEPICCIIAQ